MSKPILPVRRATQRRGGVCFQATVDDDNAGG